MTEQKIIAQKRTNHSKIYLSIFMFFFCSAFMVLMYFIDDEPDAYIYLIIATCIALGDVFSLLILLREKRLPDVLIYLEDGVLHFYNGFECRPEDIRDIHTTYETYNNTVLNSGKIVIYTDKGKIVCKKIKDLAYTTTAVMSFKYGRVYTTEELKIKMARRAN